MPGGCCRIWYRLASKVKCGAAGWNQVCPLTLFHSGQGIISYGNPFLWRDHPVST
jgi:hypothetical protein